MKIVALIILVLVPVLCRAQLLEFHSVKRLPPAVNTAGEESLPMLSPDGQLFFTRALYAGNTGGKFTGIDVWYSQGAAASWTNASNSIPGGINNGGHNAIIGLSADGKKRYFLNARPNEKVSGIYVTTKLNNYWSRPEPIVIPGIENQSFLGVYVSPEADVILLSMKAPDSRGEEDLYFSVKNASGQWSAPRNLGATINTTGFEISPFLSPDKKRLYFASNGHGGEGGADIFYSDRLYNSWEAWTVPVNLGKAVNSKKFDAYFSIYGDSVGYFASNRDGKFADLYEVKVTRARTVLKQGQRYLTSSESNRELGGAVSNEVVFAPNVSTLTSAQKELLFYIANKLQLQKRILFHLVVTEEVSPERTEAQLNAMKDHLVQSGIGEDRIIVEQVAPPAKAGSTKIIIRLVE